MKSINEIFKVQKDLQNSIGLGVGKENIVQWYNSLTAATLEIGEALSEDTRWKVLINGNTKEPKVNRENVIEETADIFIYLINACIFYDISAKELIQAIDIKQDKNLKRLTKSLTKRNLYDNNI